MIRDLRKHHAAVLTTDICIVGAGAAGIALANEFVGSGKRVLLLESGGERFDPGVDALSAGEVAGLPFRGLTLGRYRGLGGATRLWAGQCVHFDSIDFEPRPWVPGSEWPITLAGLQPYYVRAEHFMGLTGHEAYDERVWSAFSIPGPALDRSRLGARFTVLSPHPDLSRVYRRRLHEAKNVVVGLYGHALKLHLSEDASAIASLDLGILGRPPVRVDAQTFILSNGGLESARLLLLSDAEDPRGIGNAHDNVGRFYQDHPNAVVGSIATANETYLQDAFTLLYRGRKKYFPKLHLSAGVQRRERVLNAVAHLKFYYEAEAFEDLRAFVRAARRRKLPNQVVPRSWRIAREAGNAMSVFYRRYFRGRSPNLKAKDILLQVHVEQAPDRDSRLTLGDTLDAFGQRRARVDWRLGELEHRTFATMAQTVKEEFERLQIGAVKLEEWTRDPNLDWTSKIDDAYHNIGTTRMSSGPHSGVVDADLRVHGVRNLHICSSSVFPTAGYANPTLTIVALAFRLADLLKARP